MDVKPENRSVVACDWELGGGDGNTLKLVCGDNPVVAQLDKFTKNHSVVNLQWLDFIVCNLFL